MINMCPGPCRNVCVRLFQHRAPSRQTAVSFGQWNLDYGCSLRSSTWTWSALPLVVGSFLETRQYLVGNHVSCSPSLVVSNAQTKSSLSRSATLEPLVWSWGGAGYLETTPDLHNERLCLMQKIKVFNQELMSFEFMRVVNGTLQSCASSPSGFPQSESRSCETLVLLTN